MVTTMVIVVVEVVVIIGGSSSLPLSVCLSVHLYVSLHLCLSYFVTP